MDKTMMETQVTQDMIDAINEELVKRNEKFTVSLQASKKPCGEEYGVMINTNDSTKPVIYPTDTSLTPDNICKVTNNIIEVYRENINVRFDVDKFISKDYIEANVMPRFIRKDFEEKLKENNTFYIPWLDLLVIFYINVGVAVDDMSGSITLTNPILNSVGIDTDNLFALAKTNLEQTVEITPITTILSKMMGTDILPIDDAFGPKMHVATNNKTVYGATVILTDKFIEHVRTHFGETALIIPSSVHEVIVVDAGVDDAEAVAQMIREVNSNELATKDILENHPYFFYNNGVHDKPEANTLCKNDSDTDACLELYENK